MWGWILVAILLTVLLLVFLLLRILGRNNLVLQALTGADEVLRSALSLVRCYGYVLWWGFTVPLREGLRYTAQGLLIIASVLTLLEFIPLVFHKKILTFELPWGVGVGVLLLAGFSVYHHLRDLGMHSRESILVMSLPALFESIACSDCPNPPNANEVQESLLATLEVFWKTFEARVPKSVHLNVMTCSHEGERLSIIVKYPPSIEYEPNLTIPYGEGGAGIALKQKELVYIPAIKYRHGIQISFRERHESQRKLRLLKECYITTYTAPFKCVLCVPVFVKGRGWIAVINIDCQRQNILQEFDFEIGQLLASIVGVTLSKSAN